MGNTNNTMTKSKPKLDKIHLQHNNEKVKIKYYFSSHYFSSVGILMQGEKSNQEYKTRNAMISITNTRNGNSISKILLFGLYLPLSN